MINYPIVHEGDSDGAFKNYSYHAMHFDSAQQFVTVANHLHQGTAPAAMLARKGDVNEYYDREGSFNGYKTGLDQMNEVLNRKCSEDVRQRVHAATIDINMSSTGHAELDQVDLYHDECGQFLDSNAYFNGDDFNMVSMEHQQQTKPIVYIACSIGASCSWRDSHFQNRGIACIRAVHALERMGVSVGVIGYSVAMVTDSKISKKQRKPQRPVYTVIIKAPEQALDETDLINTLTNAGMSRLAGFSIKYYLLSCPSPSLGISGTLTREDLKHAGLGNIEIAVLPVDDQGHFDSPESATALLLKTINKQTSITI